MRSEAVLLYQVYYIGHVEYEQYRAEYILVAKDVFRSLLVVKERMRSSECCHHWLAPEGHQATKTLH